MHQMHVLVSSWLTVATAGTQTLDAGFKVCGKQNWHKQDSLCRPVRQPLNVQTAARRCVMDCGQQSAGPGHIVCLLH